MWLVTNFHPLGSLYDYLQRPPSSLILSPSAALRLLLTACRGLDHLHSELKAIQRKPGIAHRDIKSKNILVRDDLSCVLADFGLAVTHWEGGDKENERDNDGSRNGSLYFPMHTTKARVGTIR